MVDKAFATDAERQYFVYRVYLILSSSLLSCSLLVVVPNYFDEFLIWWEEWYIFALFLAGLVYIITFLVFVFSRAARQCYPCNLILYLVMVLCLGMISLSLSIYYETFIIVYALLSSFAFTLVMTIAARLLSVDFTSWRTMFCILAWALVPIVIVGLVLLSLYKSSFFLLLAACISVIIIALWMLYDTQRILGGERGLKENEYLLGAIHLYSDIVCFFHCLSPLYCCAYEYRV